MATGRLGSADLAAATYTPLYVVPANTYTAISVNFVNRSNTTVNVRLSLSATANIGSPIASEWIEYNTQLTGNQVLERTGLIADTGANIVVWASSALVTAFAYGIESSTT
jgi:hypothetical protein